VIWEKKSFTQQMTRILTVEDVTTSMPMMSFVPSGAARIIVGMSTEERFVNRWKENDGKAY